MCKLKYYISEQISEHVIRITSKTGEFMYLVEGAGKAVLIDTCVGIGHLREFVEKLTNKDIIVILTHGHVDHAMGAPEFAEVYMNSADNDIFMEHRALEVRKGYIGMCLADQMPVIEDSDYVQPADPDFHPLEDGMIFDLGGVTLILYATPGHTPGSMTILIKEERTLLLGDACNPSTFLFDEHALSVEEYKDNLTELNLKTKGTYDRVYLSHGVSEASKGMIESVIKVCDDILNGTTDDIPMNFMGNQAYIAKAVGNDRGRIDGGLGNIIYNKNNVWKTKK